MELLDYFFTVSLEATRIPWKIFDRSTRRKLSDDYGNESGDAYYDKMIVWDRVLKYDKKGNPFYRVTVYKPDWAEVR